MMIFWDPTILAAAITLGCGVVFSAELNG